MKKPVLILLLICLITTPLMSMIIRSNDPKKVYDMDSDGHLDLLVKDVLADDSILGGFFIFEEDSEEGYNYLEYENKKKEYLKDLIVRENLNDRESLREYIKNNSTVIQQDLLTLKGEVEKMVVNADRSFTNFRAFPYLSRLWLISYFKNDLGQKIPAPEGFVAQMIHLDTDEKQMIPLDREMVELDMFHMGEWEVSFINTNTDEIWDIQNIDFHFDLTQECDPSMGFSIVPEVKENYCTYTIDFSPEVYGASGYDFYYRVLYDDVEEFIKWGESIEIDIYESTDLIVDSYEHIFFEGVLDEFGSVGND